MAKIRINKYLADAGISSRRGAEKLILDGRVKLNGKVVDNLSTTVHNVNDSVTVDDKAISPAAKKVIIMFNKPKGCITSASDDYGRKTVFDYIDITTVRLFTVGRLDYDSEGLLLLTNDGELANKISHPTGEIPKTYLVKVEGEIEEHKMAQLRKGVEIDGEKTKRSKVKLLEFKDGVSRIEITITEGRNRQVRRMFSAVGKEVVFLKRIAVGELRLGGLSRGAYRYLNENEMTYLSKI